MRVVNNKFITQMHSVCLNHHPQLDPINSVVKLLIRHEEWITDVSMTIHLLDVPCMVNSFTFIGWSMTIDLVSAIFPCSSISQNLTLLPAGYSQSRGSLILNVVGRGKAGPAANAPVALGITSGTHQHPFQRGKINDSKALTCF